MEFITEKDSEDDKEFGVDDKEVAVDDKEDIEVIEERDNNNTDADKASSFEEENRF